MTVVITRPIEDAVTLSNHLNNLGIDTIVEPLFRIKYKSIDLNKIITASDIEGIIFTSKHAVHALNDTAKLPSNIKYFAVGETTALCLSKLGCKNIHTANNNVNNLIKLIKKHCTNRRKLLYLRGNKVSIDLKKQMHFIEEQIAYETVPIHCLSSHLISQLQNYHIKVITFFSKNTAKIFFTLLEYHKIEIAKFFKKVTIVVISNNVKNFIANFGLNRIETFSNQKNLINIISKLV